MYPQIRLVPKRSTIVCTIYDKTDSQSIQNLHTYSKLQLLSFLSWLNCLFVNYPADKPL